MYQISCFADEIAPKLADQLSVMEKMQVRFLSLRSVEGINVLNLTDSQVDEIHAALQAKGMGVSSIGSPIGKSDIADESGDYLKQTERAIAVAKKLDCTRIRVFSFYNPSGIPAWREKASARLSEMTALAEAEGMILMHENEAGIYGESSIHCRELLCDVNSPSFQAVFDPSNFVAAGEKPFTQSLPQVKEQVSYMHIKDSRHSDGIIVPAGEGDGQVSDILKAFAGKDMFLTLEPHLIYAGKNQGFTGAELFETAYRALTGLLQEAQIAYQ